MAGSNNGNVPQPAPEPGDAAGKFLRQAKDLLRPMMVREIPDEYFQQGREVELKRRVEQLVDAWLVRDKVPIGRQLRLRLLEEIFADIDQARRERSGN